jgi:uncharacterized membrane protein YfcA
MDVALLVFGVFAAAVVAGFAGFAFSLVAAGVLFHIRDPVTASALLLSCSVAAQAVSFAKLRIVPQWGVLGPLVLPAFAGIPVGAALLETLDGATVRTCLGVFLVAYGAAMLTRPRPVALGRAARLLDGGVGFAGGVMGGLVGISGALPTAWALVRDWPPATRRMAYQYYIAIVQVSSLAYLLVAVDVPAGTMGDLAVAIPVTLAGALLGARLYAATHADRARTAILLLLVATGAGLVIGGGETPGHRCGPDALHEGCPPG